MVYTTVSGTTVKYESKFKLNFNLNPAYEQPSVIQEGPESPSAQPYAASSWPEVVIVFSTGPPAQRGIVNLNHASSARLD